MSRVSSETIQKIKDFFDTLPSDVKGKCSLCNETLTHIVKQAEVATGAGTATVARVLADEINDGVAPGDVVSGDQLRDRVRQRSGEKKRLSGAIPQINNDNGELINGSLPKPGTMAYLSYSSQQYATMAESQIDRIAVLEGDPLKVDALERVLRYVQKKLEEVKNAER